MRVALVSDWFLPRMGGIELHLRDLALVLRRVGIDARVVTSTPGPDEVDDVPVHRIPARLLPFAGVAFTPSALAALGRTLVEESFDLVHAHASIVSPLAYGGATAAARASMPALITFHSMLHRSAFLLGMSERLLGWAADRVLLTAVSSVVAEQAARWIPGGSVGVLPNGIDADFWRATGTHERGAEILFVTAMRLSRKKRPARLIRAFADAVRFVAGSPPLRLVVAGSGPERAAIVRLAAELGVADRVELRGHLERDELRRLYARAHAFVLPSERESFGIAALEARAAGLPVVAMLASGVRDFVRQGVDGLLARDERELSRFMARVALDAPFREYVLHRNRASPPAYDWRDVAAMHLQLYGMAAARRRAP